MPQRDQNAIAVKPRRSVLYIPGGNARMHEKARTLAADGLIFDLEDAVGPDNKEIAREQVRASVLAGGYGGRELVVRINGLDTPWGSDDIAAMTRLPVDALLVPKVCNSGDLGLVRAAIDAAAPENSPALWAMMETPQAISRAGEITGLAADSSVGLAVLVMGTNDLAKQTGASLSAGRMALVPWLQTALIAARCHGLEILDGVFNAIGDASGFAAECRQGRQLGMDGKTLIHPAQIDYANQAFSPSDGEIADARKIIAAFAAPEHRGKAVIRLGNDMVEQLHLQMATRIVARADAISAFGFGEGCGEGGGEGGKN